MTASRRCAAVVCSGVALAWLIGLPAHAERPYPDSNQPAAAAKSLSEADGKWLAQLLTELTIDPKGAEFVAVPVKLRTVWTSEAVVKQSGWYVAAAAGQPGRVNFADGNSLTPAKDAKLDKLDFVALCRAKYDPPKEAPREEADPFARMRTAAVGDFETPDLVNAAWLHRLSEDKLAALALERASAAARNRRGAERDDKKAAAIDRAELATAVKEQFAAADFLAMVHAYMVGADDEAQAHADRLLKLKIGSKETFRQVPEIVAELKRRKTKGTFGKPPAANPVDFDSWDTAKKVAWLIDHLDEVDARQDGQPGGIDLAADPRVAELIHIGDPAVPALIDVVENDQRLTRSVHFWRDFSDDRTVLGVREAALTAVMSILRTQFFEAASTGDNFTARGEESAKQMAQRLRAYWKEYGGQPFDERMMRVLVDPKSSFEARREAADNLATLGQERGLHTMFHPTIIGGEGPPKPNPAVAKFNKPTVAEAMLAAMDADLKSHDAQPKDKDHLQDYERRRIEDEYLGPLTELGDRRIVGELARRSRAAETVRMRRKWAYAAHHLGDSRPLDEFADDFRLGKIRPPTNSEANTNDNDQAGNVELLGIIRYLAGETPAADRALYALADPAHPSYKMAAARVLAEPVDWGDGQAWFQHPFCLIILRRELDDTKPTGAVDEIEHDQLVRREKNGSSSCGIPVFLADPDQRNSKAEERTCDLAAAKINELAFGSPLYHPLLKNAPQRLAALKAFLDLYGKRIRSPSRLEADALGLSEWRPCYLPEIVPLGHAATADDVKAGRAVFQLDGQGKLAETALPAVATLKAQAKQDNPAVLIVQAEIGSDGVVHYGVIARNDVRSATQQELTDVHALSDLERQKKK